jgi:hypothetical protein
MSNYQYAPQRQRDFIIMESMYAAGYERAINRRDVLARSSRAISIKRSSSSCSNDCDEITDRGANYEMATWRMYNRILNHRMMKQGSEGSSSSSSSEDEATIVSEEYMAPKRVPQLYLQGRGLPATLPRKGRHDLKRRASITLEGDEEGIFQLDL